MDPKPSDPKQLEQRVADLQKQLENVKQKLAGTATEARVNTLGASVDVLSAERNKREAEAEIRRNRLVNPMLGVNGDEAAKFLRITSRLTRPDPLTVAALADARKPFSDANEVLLASTFVQSKGLATAMTRVSSALNGSGTLDETNRLLLSEPHIYAALVRKVLRQIEDAAPGTPGEKRQALEKFVQDKEGFRIALLDALEADDGPKHKFIAAVAAAALQRSGAELDESKLAGKRLITELRRHPAPLGEGRVQAAIEAAYEQVLNEGIFPTLVDAYVDTREIDANRFTPEIRRAMVRHLITRGIQINLDDDAQKLRFLNGGYDEYFAVAYEQAVSSAAGEDDPIVAASTKGATVAPWDFTVDTFESMEEQGVVRDNILAAGALDYIYELGERLGIFRLVDALTLNWAAGAIDVVDGPCAAKLYRYWKLRDQRMDPAERGLVYKRVLNKGETQALDRMVVNENFESLWGTLCEKVAEYRAKVEDAKVEQGDAILVSRTPIYQAVRDLQYNLTDFCTGMAHMQVREMYSQLREAMDLLGDPEIVDHFAGGRRKTMWTAIERLAKSEFGEAPNINAIRIAAVEGNAVFRFIANFQQNAVAEEDFQRFLEAAEAWIIAKGSDDGGFKVEDKTDREDDTEDTETDDFSDEDM